MAKAKIPVSVGGLEFDALITEEFTLEAEIPEYSVEEGYAVSDSVILGAETLSMTLFLTDLPVTWKDRHGTNNGRTESVIKKLKDLYYAKEPVTVKTSDYTYTDMAIESLTLSKSLETGYAREIPVTFRKIRYTETSTTTIPDSYGKSGTSQTSTGTANTSSETTEDDSTSSSSTDSSSSSSDSSSSKSSILYNIGSSVSSLLGL